MKRRGIARLLVSFLLIAFGLASPAPPAPGAIRLTGALRQGSLVYGNAPPGTVRLALDGTPVPLDQAGMFILGFDRDQPGNALLVGWRADGSSVRQDLRIAPRAWRIERINLPRPKAATPEYLRLREIELRRIEEARAIDNSSDGWRQRFVAPARGRFTGRFGSQRVYRGEPASYHSGLDMAAGGGAPVVAPADGVVVLAGPPRFSLEGNLVVIDHGMGLNSALLHLATVAVSPGQVVRRGQRIGTVGATGRATGPHLHWSVRWKDARLDPEGLLAGPDR